MKKINKDYSKLLSTKYKAWLDNHEANNQMHPTSRTYYDDIVMELYRIQGGVCAYTERYICPSSLYTAEHWVGGDYKISDKDEFTRIDHAGELEHFDPTQKKDKYWLWSNLFMIDSTINSQKSNKSIVSYLKPDLDDYEPSKYFDYDQKTHKFVPNTDLQDDQRKEIQYMIDEILRLNHGVIKNDRRDFINI
jgi:hypothetical protein